jgi:hypothetical protein
MARCPHMSSTEPLSDVELASLKEVGRGICHDSIPTAHSARLLELGLIYSLFGDLRITKAGRAQITRAP